MKKFTLVTLRIIVAVVLIQTLRFKFTTHPDSVYIFNKVGLEPYGRIGVGILELIAGILILIPKTIWLGALLTISLMLGAVTMHLTILGINVNNDNGLLFYTALGTLIISSIILYDYRSNIPFKKLNLLK